MRCLEISGNINKSDRKVTSCKPSITEHEGMSRYLQGLRTDPHGSRDPL